ncbi:hypothetical protein [Deinococcus altitudinis]|uniref:hypothetical protein n=1 Tax=Deinococcus altitudinis TaxID=468914 RepID=UPI0038912121
MIKDDMAIHANIPEKAVKAALEEFRSEPIGSTVTWDMARARPGRPIKLYLEAVSTAEIQAAKRRLEQLLEANGFNLYP